MPYACSLRTLFPEFEPTVADLFALGAHQIAELPERAPSRELAEVLHGYPEVRAFLEVRHPPIAEYLSQLLDQHAPASRDDLEASEQTLLWEVADWIVYDTAPEMYDALPLHDWDFQAIANVVELDGMTVIDAGAGTGRVAFEAARRAHHVFAVEPVVRLREFMREKAARSGVTNIFVLDGTLGAIPLPTDTADVLVTCRAIGWRLEEELVEIERVVRAGGTALHLGVPSPASDGGIVHRRLSEVGYVAATSGEVETRRTLQWTRL
jgi:SAM-dependent methyltransferase